MQSLGSSGDPAKAENRMHTVELDSPLIVHAFAGPDGKKSSLSCELRSVGLQCHDIDTRREGIPDMDLLDDTVWESVKTMLQEKAKGAMVDPPCGTFSRVRNHRPGPPVLRSTEHIHGLPEIRAVAKHKEELRKADILAERAIETCEIMHSRGLPFGFESPAPVADEPSIFLLPRAIALAKLPGVFSVVFDQCRFGALTTKPSQILAFKLPISDWCELRCSHTPDWHEFLDAYGTSHWKWSAHPPIAGNKAMGQWASAAAAAFPQELNVGLARAFASAVLESEIECAPIIAE